MPTSAPFLIFILYRESLFLLQSMPTSGSGREVSVCPSITTFFATFQRVGTNMNMNPFAPPQWLSLLLGDLLRAQTKQISSVNHSD